LLPTLSCQKYVFLLSPIYSCKNTLSYAILFATYTIVPKVCNFNKKYPIYSWLAYAPSPVIWLLIDYCLTFCEPYFSYSQTCIERCWLIDWLIYYCVTSNEQYSSYRQTCIQRCWLIDWLIYYYANTVGWSPRNSVPGEYIQAYFYNIITFKGIVTAGNPRSSEWVTQYKLRYQYDWFFSCKLDKKQTLENIFKESAFLHEYIGYFLLKLHTFGTIV
jgi:hypothetical protein